MKNNFITISALLFLMMTAHAESSFEQQLQEGCAKIKQYGTLGKKYYDNKDYKKALEQFEDQSAWTSFCLANIEESGIQITEHDVDVANNNVGLTYAKSNRPQWARAWFLRNKNSKLSQFNLRQLPTPKKSNNLAGTYVSPIRFGQWNVITVNKNKKNYDISFDGYYFGLRGLIYGPNMGQFDTSMPLSSKNTFYQFENCKINLAFNFNINYGNIIEVDQKQSDIGCGFGLNVGADGLYIKVDK